MKGLALAHALTTQTPTVSLALKQQLLIRKSIEVRDLSSRVMKPIKDVSGTKIARAAVLFQRNPDATRNEMITMFVSQLGLTSAGATTYYSKLKSEV